MFSLYGTDKVVSKLQKVAPKAGWGSFALPAPLSNPQPWSIIPLPVFPPTPSLYFLRGESILRCAFPDAGPASADTPTPRIDAYSSNLPTASLDTPAGWREASAAALYAGLLKCGGGRRSIVRGVGTRGAFVFAFRGGWGYNRLVLHNEATVVSRFIR